MSDNPNPAIALLELERRLQSSSSNREVAFRAVNDSSQVLRFDQAVLWRRDLFERPMVVVASGLADITVDSPFQQWLAHLVQSITPDPFEQVQSLSVTALPEAVVEEGEEWCPEHLLHCPLVGPNGRLLGGLLFFRQEAFSEAERAVAEWISRSTGYALWAWRSDRHSLRHWLRRAATRRMLAYALLAAALVAFIPVRLSVLAPAEVTPVRPIPVTSPLEGVVQEIVVKPNQIVKADEVVAALDDTSLRNRLEVAGKALDIARADLQRATFKSFSDDSARLELAVLNARVQEKLAEVTFVTELLSKTQLTAPQGGVAIFTSQEDWRGRPVQVGERVMLIADPSLVDTTIYLPPDDAIELEQGAPVTLLLHVDPLTPLDATIERASYDAVPAPDGTLAYVVHAQFTRANPLPRIGMRGTAKIYGPRVALGYYLLRKPLAFIRRTVGI